MKFKFFIMILVLIFSSTSFSQIRPQGRRLKGHTKKGMHLYQQGELDKAEQEFLMALKINKKNFFANEMLAQIYYQKKNYKEAFKYAERAIKQNPRVTKAHLTIGAILLKRGEKEKANERFRRAIENARTQEEKGRVQNFIANLREGKGDILFGHRRTKAPLDIPSAAEEPVIQSTRKPYVAVFPFKETNIRTEHTKIGETLSEMLTTALIQTNRFNVMERAQLQKVLEEQSLGQTGTLDSETAVEVGKLIGVEAVVMGSVSQLKSVIEGDARIIEIETGKSLTAVNAKVNNIDRMRDLATELARQLAGKASLIKTKEVITQQDSIKQDLKE